MKPVVFLLLFLSFCANAQQTVHESFLKMNVEICDDKKEVSDAQFFSIATNPVQTEIRILSTLSKYRIRLFNADSRELYHQEVYDMKDVRVDCSKLKKGIYILVLESENLRETHKIIKD